MPAGMLWSPGDKIFIRRNFHKGCTLAKKLLDASKAKELQDREHHRLKEKERQAKWAEWKKNCEQEHQAKWKKYEQERQAEWRKQEQERQAKWTEWKEYYEQEMAKENDMLGFLPVAEDRHLS